jgi:hypothetical protein
MADPRITQIIEALERLYPLTAYGLPGTRDVEQAEHQRNLYAALAAARSLQAATQAQQPAQQTDLHAAIRALPLPQGFTVHMSPDPEAMPATWYDEQDMRDYAHAAAALVAASQQQPAQQAVRVALTNEQIDAACAARELFPVSVVPLHHQIARAIEAAHGIALPPAAKEGEKKQ